MTTAAGAPASPYRYRGSLAVCALLIAYASLYPFAPLRPPGPGWLADFLRPRYITAFDVFLNALAYLPLGALACLALRNSGAGAAIARALAACVAFSLAMEACQLFVANRVASVADVAANGAGALAGALAYRDPLYSLVTRPLGALRERVVIPGAWGDAGLVLVALWLVAQLNPALPFFEAGNIPLGSGDAVRLEVLQAAAVGLSACGFGLFLSVLLASPRGALRVTLLLLTAALWLKFAAASLMLRPHLSADWVDEGRMLGLGAGLALFLPLRRFGATARTYLAALMILAGALFSKIFGAYSPIEDLLRVFAWPHGQLASFASLTRYLNETWPLLALAFLVGLFVRERRGAVES